MEQGFKADMAGVAEARKRADDKHRTERLLDEQMRDKMRRQADEQAQEAVELAAAQKVLEERDAAMKARRAAAAEAARALSEQIRQYNKCALVPVGPAWRVPARHGSLPTSHDLHSRSLQLHACSAVRMHTASMPFAA